MGYGNCLFSGEKNIRRACSRNQNGKYDARGHSKIHFTLKRKKGAGRATNCRALKSYSTQQDIIEKARNVDMDRLENEIEEEANRLARRKYKILD